MGAGAGAQEDDEETAVVAEGGGDGGGEEQVAEEGEGDEEQVGEGGQEKAAAVVSCSICLDTVVAGGAERSTARLQCGHEFHLGERLRCLEISRSFFLLCHVCWGGGRWRREDAS
jgi:hypothetical protein